MKKGLKGATGLGGRVEPTASGAGERAGRVRTEKGKGWTAGQTKPLLLHFCPSGQTPTLYTCALPSYALFLPPPSSFSFSPLSQADARGEPTRTAADVPRRAGLSVAVLFEFVN